MHLFLNLSKTFSIALNKLEIKEATRIFESIVESDPEHHLTQIFLGMCLFLTKGKIDKGKKIIKEALEKTDDETIKNLGNLSLQWADKDLTKKTKALFFAKSLFKIFDWMICVLKSAISSQKFFAILLRCVYSRLLSKPKSCASVCPCDMHLIPFIKNKVINSLNLFE